MLKKTPGPLVSEVLQKSLRWSTVIGIALVFHSEYFVRLSSKKFSYFLHSVMWDIVIPVLAACAGLTALIYAVVIRLRTGTYSLWLNWVALFGLAICVVGAAHGLIAIFGFEQDSLIELLVGMTGSVEKKRILKVLFFLIPALLFLVASSFTRYRYLDHCIRMLSAFGYSLVFITAFNLLVNRPMELKLAWPDQVTWTGVRSHGSEHIPERRVIWIVFDELDYALSFGAANKSPISKYPNMQFLASRGVMAADAHAPSNVTLVSLPALLIGAPAINARINGQASIDLLTKTGVHSFDVKNSIFGRLHSQGKEFSILGFYHPYCNIFVEAAACWTHSEHKTDNWYDAIFYKFPKNISGKIDPMYQISTKQLGLISEYIARQSDSVTFLHINLPHLPGRFSQNYFNMQRSNDYDIQYESNLRLVDKILGQIISEVGQLSKDQRTLLVITGDHGFRMKGKNPATSRAVPWVAWDGSQDGGMLISKKISTVNTSALISKYLNKEVNSYSDMADWWSSAPLYLPWTPPAGYAY